MTNSQNFPHTLMRDMHEGDEGYVDLQKYIDNIDEDNKTPDAICTERLNICRLCSNLNQAICNKCGCFVELRASMKNQYCPMDKW